MQKIGDKIIINNLLVPAKIGILDEEKKSDQRIRIRCTLTLAPMARQGVDKIEDTVCYASLRDDIIRHLQSGHINLLETAAEDIATLCLRDKRVHSAAVAVEKLDIFKDADSVGVEIFRERHEGPIQ